MVDFPGFDSGYRVGGRFIAPASRSCIDLEMQLLSPGEAMRNRTKTLVSATRFIRKLRGGSQPVLVGASDGNQYVVKFPNNFQGANVLCNEVLGTELYRTIGLPSPGWKPIFVSEDFIRLNPGCRIEGPHGSLQPKGGLCYGSAFLGTSAGSLYEILPGPYWQRVRNRQDFWLAWLVDLCADHWDNRQAVFLDNAKSISAIFIDHGHMFGGPNGSRKPPVLGPRHLDARVYAGPDRRTQIALQRSWASVDLDKLIEKPALVPEQWATQSAISNFLAFVERISRADNWKNALEAIIASGSTQDAHAATFPIFDQVLRPCLHFAPARRTVVA